MPTSGDALREGGCCDVATTPNGPSVAELVGLSDLFALASAAFTYPENDGLAHALASGAFLADVSACCADAGISGAAAVAFEGELRAFVGCDPVALGVSLRRAYSALYLAPGSATPVWPYEAPFLFRESGRRGTPSLFRSPVTLSVAKCYGQEGFSPAPDGAPADGIWHELSFMGFMLGRAAAELAAGRSDRSLRLRQNAMAFYGQHGKGWMPLFFEQTVRQSAVRQNLDAYAVLARWALAVLNLFDVRCGVQAADYSATDDANQPLLGDSEKTLS